MSDLRKRWNDRITDNFGPWFPMSDLAKRSTKMSDIESVPSKAPKPRVAIRHKGRVIHMVFKDGQDAANVAAALASGEAIDVLAATGALAGMSNRSRSLALSLMTPGSTAGPDLAAD